MFGQIVVNNTVNINYSDYLLHENYHFNLWKYTAKNIYKTYIYVCKLRSPLLLQYLLLYSDMSNFIPV